MNTHIPEDVYIGELISYPGPWAFQLPGAGIILVSDEELVDMANDPDKVLNLATGFDIYERSLRQICEGANKHGARKLMAAFDHFFRQYRPGTDSPRKLTPDMDEYVQLIAKISQFASGYGLRLELSLLSPLEIGTAYAKATGESGRWMHYRKGLRDPKTGAFSVQLWQHKRWVNNKGPIDVTPENVRVFAFREQSLRGTPYRVVNPDSIVEISEVAKTEVYEGLIGSIARRACISGEGRTDVGDLDRVLVVQHYSVPEMDYFSDSALPYLKTLLNKYIDAGVKLYGLYSDEMHIQQDWDYFGHHDHGQFALRYVSPGLENKYADQFGEQYRDFAKYMLYFTYGQEDFATNLTANEGVMHVFGSSPQEIHQTALFRSRYYALLQNGVVDLFVEAKRYAEQKIGYMLETRAHATWAESPTIDCWRTGTTNINSRKYEYTSDFVWSNTVHQAASACHDYFKWGEFLTGTGNDHPEGGWLDRDYYGLALACSTGIINDVPYSYCAHWGHPAEVSWRRHQLQNAFGVVGGMNVFSLVQDMSHRDVDVMMLYPLDLVSAEERFGSWTTQYAYANMITQAKLLEMGIVKNGSLEIAGRRFSTLAAIFEPFPSPKLLDMMRELTETGGRVIWSGPPPLINSNGESVLERWQELFGVSHIPDSGGWGKSVPGHQVTFDGVLKEVAPQIILTDFLVDHIFPVTLKTGSEIVARCGKYVVGTYHPISKGGSFTFLGYRPRDDQSASLGYETRNWFEVLNNLGAYPNATEQNDNTEVISRTTDYLACRFPNGAVALAPHLTQLEEDWPGGFARNHEQDEEIVKRLNLPPNRIHLESFWVNGYCVDYEGSGAVAFRMDKDGNLIAFAGYDCASITIDGAKFAFADKPVGQIGWAPVPQNRHVENGAKLMVFCNTAGKIRIPANAYPDNLAFYAEASTPGQKGESVLCELEGDNLTIEITESVKSRWLFGILTV
jgi:hypothetical protein